MKDSSFLIALITMMIGNGGAIWKVLNIYYKRKDAQDALKEKEALEIRQSHEKQLAEMSFKLEKVADITCALAQYRIKREVDKHSEQNEITSDDRSVIEEMYEPYEALGRNHYAHNAIVAMQNIPIVNKYNTKDGE
nr:MAG TPA: hypothetical protein [Caudoviricetes sp.]